jgi:hypothetical protein
VPLLVYMKLRRTGLIVGDTNGDDAAAAGKSAN